MLYFEVWATPERDAKKKRIDVKVLNKIEKHIVSNI